MPIRGDRTDLPTYRELRPLQGGTSLLTDCKHEILGDRCIQKTVPISVAGAPAFLEPRLLHTFDHPNIPPVRDAQFDPEKRDHITFVMPRYEGGSVAAQLAGGLRMSIGQAVDLTRQALSALEYAHTDIRYVHRDVKPGNLLLDATLSQCFLADWELAAPIEADGSAPMLPATIQYMAPEAVPSKRHAPPADIYAMGLSLFEMLNGRIPWETLTDNTTVERRITRGQRALPGRIFDMSAFAVHVPDTLRRLVRKAIHQNPDKRHQSARELIRALNQVDYIDWTHTDGDGLDGTWTGTWPPSRTHTRRSTIVIESRILKAGPNSGQRRLTAHRTKAGSTSSRQFGVGPLTIEPDNVDAARQFFNDVADKLAHR